MTCPFLKKAEKILVYTYTSMIVEQGAVGGTWKDGQGGGGGGGGSLRVCEHNVGRAERPAR
jgi:hypothetical protein